MINICIVDTQTRNDLLFRVTKLADEDDQILGNTAMYTFEGDRLIAFVDDLTDTVVGFIQYYVKKTKPEISLHRICVNKNYRRQGFGRLLIEKMIASHPEIQSVLLKCPVGISANNFYQALDFINEGIVEARTGRKLILWRKIL